MTQKMSTHEMLEMASLDALGLLSEDERLAFERAFSAAPPALQAQIRADQARVAGDDSLLPRIDPPLGLRARVLAAVREAMQSVGGRPVGRIAPDILPGRGVSPIWRAAAIGLMAASIVFAFTTLQMRREYESITSRLVSDAWTEQFLAEFGPKFERMLYDPKTQRVAFTAAEGDETLRQAGAVLLLDPETGVGELLCKNLPMTDGEYELVLVDESGEVRGEAILTFRPTGTRFHQGIQQDRSDPGLTLAIVTTERGAGRRMLLLQAS